MITLSSLLLYWWSCGLMSPRCVRLKVGCDEFWKSHVVDRKHIQLVQAANRNTPQFISVFTRFSLGGQTLWTLWRSQSLNQDAACVSSPKLINCKEGTLWWTVDTVCMLRFTLWRPWKVKDSRADGRDGWIRGMKDKQICLKSCLWPPAARVTDCFNKQEKLQIPVYVVLSHLTLKARAAKHFSHTLKI